MGNEPRCTKEIHELLIDVEFYIGYSITYLLTLFGTVIIDKLL